MSFKHAGELSATHHQLLSVFQYGGLNVGDHMFVELHEFWSPEDPDCNRACTVTKLAGVVVRLVAGYGGEACEAPGFLPDEPFPIDDTYASGAPRFFGLQSGFGSMRRILVPVEFTT